MRPKSLPLGHHTHPQLISGQTRLVDAVVRQLPREPRPDVLNGVQVRALRCPRQRYDLPNKKIIIRLLPVNYAAQLVRFRRENSPAHDFASDV